jgi:tripartite-type tricarboxylate transporter receptor subunit TctC
MTIRSNNLVAITALVLAVFTFFSTSANSQADWPARPVSVIVGYPAGSATDAAARVVTGPLAKKLGQPVIIENRGGADGMIAGRAIARSEPNGYTMGFSTTTSWALSLNMQPQQMGFDPRKDFASVSLLGDTHYLLIVNAELGVNSVAELVALAKRSKPGSLNFSSTGDGSIAHLGMLILAKKLGIEMTHVPYKSTAQSIVDVASGVIQLQLATISPTIPLVQTGKVRVLGIASDRRSPLMPDVPTLAEQGAATTASFSLGFVFPTGTPEAIVRRSSEAFRDIIQDEVVKKALLQQGVEPRSSSAEEMDQHIASEVAAYRNIVTEFEITPR